MFQDKLCWFHPRKYDATNTHLRSSPSVVKHLPGLLCGEFAAHRPVTRSFDVFFDLHPNKWLSKQWRRWLFETPSHWLWRHCNDMRPNNHHQSAVAVQYAKITTDLQNNIPVTNYMAYIEIEHSQTFNQINNSVETFCKWITVQGIVFCQQYCNFMMYTPFLIEQGDINFIIIFSKFQLVWLTSAFTWMVAAHLHLVPHICVSELGQL